MYYWNHDVEDKNIVAEYIDIEAHKVIGKIIRIPPQHNNWYRSHYAFMLAPFQGKTIFFATANTCIEAGAGSLLNVYDLDMAKTIVEIWVKEGKESMLSQEEIETYRLIKRSNAR